MGDRLATEGARSDGATATADPSANGRPARGENAMAPGGARWIERGRRTEPATTRDPDAQCTRSPVRPAPCCSAGTGARGALPHWKQPSRLLPGAAAAAVVLRIAHPRVLRGGRTTSNSRSRVAAAAVVRSPVEVRGSSVRRGEARTLGDGGKPPRVRRCGLSVWLLPPRPRSNGRFDRQASRPACCRRSPHIRSRAGPRAPSPSFHPCPSPRARDLA